MNKKSFYFLSILGIIILISSNPISAWTSNKIYVQKVDTAPLIDGEISDGEWDTQEERFQETISGLSFENGSQTTIILSLVALRDDNYLYLLVTIISKISDSDTMSVGIALSEKNMDKISAGQTKMSQSFDRKIAYYNGSATIPYDLHKCGAQGDPCTTARDLQPGIDDSNNEMKVEYSKSGENNFFEFKIPFKGNSSEDIDIKEGTHIKILINPYQDIYLEGHGAIGTKDLELIYSPKPLFERPEGPMDNLAIIFNIMFELVVIGFSLAFILSARSEKIAKKLWRVDINEDMVNNSILMEFGYYNSSFLGLFTMFFLLLYSYIALLYGIWANWGLTGGIINGVPVIIGSIAFIDLLKRNHNPQDIPKEESKQMGVNVEKSGALWVIPPAFLGLVLFMLVFIGIDVIS